MFTFMSYQTQDRHVAATVAASLNAFDGPDLYGRWSLDRRSPASAPSAEKPHRSRVHFRSLAINGKYRIPLGSMPKSLRLTKVDR